MYLISDQRSNRIIGLPVLDADALIQPLSAPPSVGALAGPAGIFLDASRRLYIADSGNDRIVTVAFDTMEWTSFGVAPLARPIDVAADASGRIYAVDGRRIVRADAADGSGAIVLPETAGGPRPVAITLDADGRLLIADASTHALAFSEDEGASWKQLPPPDGANLFTPVSLAPRRGGGFLAADLANRRVVALTLDGTSATLIDASDGLVAPIRACEDGPGITVLDAAAGWIRRFLPVGERYVAADFVRGRSQGGIDRFGRPVGLSIGALP